MDAGSNKQLGLIWESKRVLAFRDQEIALLCPFGYILEHKFIIGVRF
jgi:hypothetical protein